MPITAITIKNFKGIREPLRVDLKPITLLFGPNSSGKSTIIHALHYAREIFERHNLDPGKTIAGGNSVDLGGFRSLVHNHDLGNAVVLRLDLDLRDEDLPQYSDGYEEIGLFQFSDKQIWEIPMRVKTSWVEITVKWNSQLGKPILQRYEVGCNQEVLATIQTTDDGRQVFISHLNAFNPVFLEGVTSEEAIDIAKKVLVHKSGDDDELEKLGPIFSALFTDFNLEGGIPGSTKPFGIVGQGTAMPEWGKMLQFVGPVWAEGTDVVDQGNFLMCLSSLIVGPGELIRDALRQFNYLGPLREAPLRNHEPPLSPDESRWASGIAAWDILYRAESSFVDKANEWLVQQDRLNSGYRIEIKEFKELDVDNPLILALLEGRVLDEEESIERFRELPLKRRLVLREEASRIEVMPQDVGVGISQVVPVIVAALHAKAGVVAIEQPELHIHPAFQVALGDLFISQINQKEDVAFLLETHSEHLMLRFLRRIRETSEETLPPGKAPLKPDDLAVYYIEQGEKGIAMMPVRINDEGDFVDRWPKGFFSERMEELF